MISRDPSCIFVAKDQGQATVVVNWLEHQGIHVQVMDTLTRGGLDGLTAWTAVSARGIEVWAVNLDDAEQARSLIVEYEETLDDLLAKKQSAGPVSTRCDLCGYASTFEGDQRGTVQNCPHCGNYLDVPDDDACDDAIDDTFDDAVDDAVDDDSMDEDSQDVATSSPSARMGSRNQSLLRNLQKPIIMFGIMLFGAVMFLISLGGVVMLARAIFRGFE